MRPRHVRPQLITIRPLVDRSADTNVFGDAPIIAADNRGASFQVIATVSWNRNTFAADMMGRTNRKSVTGILWQKDLAKPNKRDYTPQSNDIWEIVGAKLFVTSVEPLAPTPLRLGNQTGGFMGWRVTLADSNPEQRAATAYDD
jgi:hypothetical protein